MSKEFNFERMFKFVWERNHRNCRKPIKEYLSFHLKRERATFSTLSLSHTILPSSSNHNISLNSYTSIPNAGYIHQFPLVSEEKRGKMGKEMKNTELVQNTSNPKYV